jgi:hypothetical protein
MNDAINDPRDWASDAAHENGNYLNNCAICGKEFRGHKRRVVCRVCVDVDELVAENARLHREWSEMRGTFLHDPEHDNDTINWALGIVDARHFATAPEAACNERAGGEAR